MSKNIYDRRERLKIIGERLKAYIQLEKKDQEFLTEALVQIGNGVDAAIALDVKAVRGERKGPVAKAANERKSLVQQVMKDLVKTQGKTIEDASFETAKLFNLTEETIRTYYYD
jgi:hypothetical protein